MVNKCKHTWRKLYYRKRDKGEKDAKWLIVQDRIICNKCLKIAEIKENGK